MIQRGLFELYELYELLYDFHQAEKGEGDKVEQD